MNYTIKRNLYTFVQIFFVLTFLIIIFIQTTTTAFAADPCNSVCDGSDCTLALCEGMDGCTFVDATLDMFNKCSLSTTVEAIACDDACSLLETDASCVADCIAVSTDCNYDGLSGTCAIGGPIIPVNGVDPVCYAGCEGATCTIAICESLGSCSFIAGTFPSGNKCVLTSIDIAKSCSDACLPLDSAATCEADCAAIPDCYFNGAVGTCAINGPSIESPITAALDNDDGLSDTFLPEAAQQTEPLAYKLLVPEVPGSAVNPDDAEICSYLGAMFLLLMIVCAVLSVIVIVIAGTQMVIGASSPGARSDAKDRLTNAIIGLFIALLSYVVLYSINPKILDDCFFI